MSLHCAISGEMLSAEDAVVSKKSGYVFLKSLAVKAVEAEGKCPISGEELSLDDLVDVKTEKAVRPRPSTATSIPGLMTLMQNEWDELMLESYTLKQHLEATRQELSQALYQHDSACRVIARLVRERDEARGQLQGQREALASAAVSGAPVPQVAQEEAMEVEGDGLDAALVETLMTTWKSLTKKRKKREVSADLASKEVISTFKQQSSHTLHKTSPAGITCMALHPESPLVVTGGADKTAIVFNRESGKQEGVLTGHAKKVLDVSFHPSEPMVFTASADKTAKVWKDGQVVHTFDDHTAEVSGITLHPTGDFLATAGLDKSWAFHNLERGTCLKVVKNPDFEGGFSSVRWHPDGLILGTGTVDAQVRIWDMKTLTNVATFKGHTGTVNAVAFSENGYYMASASDDSTVKLWDLRKLKNFDTLQIGSKVKTCSFDHSGVYLATGADDAQVFLMKDRSEICALKGHKKPVTGVAFGPLATSLFTTSLDRCLKEFS
ncbi:unnamed protein product [Chrysoparadoxa australica]